MTDGKQYTEIQKADYEHTNKLVAICQDKGQSDYIKDLAYEELCYQFKQFILKQVDQCYREFNYVVTRDDIENEAWSLFRLLVCEFTILEGSYFNKETWNHGQKTASGKPKTHAFTMYIVPKMRGKLRTWMKQQADFRMRGAIDLDTVGTASRILRFVVRDAHEIRLVQRETVLRMLRKHVFTSKERTVIKTRIRGGTLYDAMVASGASSKQSVCKISNNALRKLKQIMLEVNGG